MTKFEELQAKIADIGLAHHGQTIVENSRRNARHIRRTIRDIAPNPDPCLVISAGPSLYREGILSRIKDVAGEFTIIAADGAYIQCLKAGIVPDWVVTIDPHPTRIVRWFGDPDFEENGKHDDYFARQDLDVDFRANSARQNEANIEEVDRNPCRLVISTSAPENVVARTAHFDRYWFAPLVDSPVKGSITRQITDATGAPALNTGGTVGTAAWCFARHILKSEDIALVGCDFGYYAGTKLEHTQEWNLLKNEPNVLEMYPPRFGHWNTGFTSPTYAWYMQNFLDLLEGDRVTNCSGGGFLVGRNINCMEIEEWLATTTTTIRRLPHGCAS